eukprot:g4246.t1
MDNNPLQSSPMLKKLWEAEQEAMKIVLQARDERSVIMKSSMAQAEQQLEKVRADMKAELAKMEADQSSSQNGSGESSALEQKTQQEIALLKKQFAQNKKAAVTLLVDAVTK